jgi:uncharacterized protein YqhQ
MKKTRIGGQAVLEGVMMRGKTRWVVAVRKPNAEIVVRDHPIKPLAERFPFLNLIIFRGILALYESMSLGIKAIMISAEESLEEEDVTISSKEMALSIVLALVLGIGIFVILPTFAIRLVDKQMGTLAVSFSEGLLRIVIFVVYLFAISKMKDIQRFFEYHGAEHKTIHAFEHGDDLKPDTVARYSSLHVRCGTAFLILVFIILVFAFALIGKPPLLWRILWRIVLIPIVAGISYEIIRLAGNHEDNLFIKLIMKPGLWLQGLTTREPSNDQLEVAIASLKQLLMLEGVEKGEDVEAAMP